MATYVDVIVQEANSLLGLMEKYSAPLDEAGFGETERNGFKLSIAEVLAKDTAQKNAVEVVRQKTMEQNDALAAALQQIRASQNAARAAFGENNSARMKEFHVGKERLNTSSTLITELAYQKDVAVKYQTELTKNGLSVDDIAAFDTFALGLTKADKEQENAKKAQVTATAGRDKSADALDKLIKKVRNIVKVKFRKDPDVQKEFSSITRKAASAKEEPAPKVAEQKK